MGREGASELMNKGVALVGVGSTGFSSSNLKSPMTMASEVVAAALADAAIATVSGGATHTLAYDLSTITGAVGATNTFTIRVTIDDSGNTGSNQVVVYAELFNAEATGVTIA